MKKKKSKKEESNVKIALWFGIFVFLIILVSLAIKVGLMIHMSLYDGIHRFNVAEKSGNQIQIVSLVPETHSIYIVRLKGNAVSYIDSRYVQKITEIPIDSTITRLSPASSTIASDLKSLVFHFREARTNLTFYDALRLWLFANSVSSQDITQNSIDLADSDSANKVVKSLFADSSIVAENLSIEIVNASGAPGMGNRVTQLLENMGCSVISVTSSDKVANSSKIVYNGSSYTSQKLKKVLKFRAFDVSVQKKAVEQLSIASIKIVVGADQASATEF